MRNGNAVRNNLKEYILEWTGIIETRRQGGRLRVYLIAMKEKFIFGRIYGAIDMAEKLTTGEWNSYSDDSDEWKLKETMIHYERRLITHNECVRRVKEILKEEPQSGETVKEGENR